MSLDTDIASALHALGVTVRAATPVTGLPSTTSDRATMRITLAGGRIVKARRHSQAAKAKAYAHLVRALDQPSLPAIVLLHGRVTIEEWVNGKPLADLRLTRARLQRAADIFGALHATQRLGRRTICARMSTRALVVDTQARIHKLTAAGALSRGDGAVLATCIRRAAPRTAYRGLTHNDFCAENIVEDASGGLFVVDNGGIRLGFLDFDLARTWYRWPMSQAAWATFIARYRTWRAPRAAEPTRFWQIAAVVRSADFRVTRRNEADVPLRRLQKFINEDLLHEGQ